MTGIEIVGITQLYAIFSLVDCLNEVYLTVEFSKKIRSPCEPFPKGNGFQSVKYFTESRLTSVWP